MPAYTSPAATQAAGHGGAGFGPRVEKVSSRLVHGRPPHWLHILLFSRRTTRVESRYTGGHTSHLGPFGPCRRPGPRCDPPAARPLPAARNEGDFAGCYYLFSAREGGRVLGAHRPGAEPMGRPLVTVRELGALGPSGVCQNVPPRTVLSAAQTTVPAVPRRIAVCTPLFSQGLDPLGVGHTGMYTGHLGLVGPDMGIGRCGDPPPPWALPTGATRGILFVHFPRRPGGGLGCLPLRRRADGFEPGGCARARRSGTTRCTPNRQRRNSGRGPKNGVYFERLLF